MTTYASPLDSQNQPYGPPDTINGWQLLEQQENWRMPEQRENWQLLEQLGQIEQQESRQLLERQENQQALEQQENRQALEQRETWQMPASDQRGNWQIVPPIVTGGRLAAVKPRNETPQNIYGQALSSQESATLFKVSFIGLDQQHYSVSATVKSPNGMPARQEHVAPGEPMLRMPAAPAQPLLHPAWQGAGSPVEVSPSTVRTAPYPSAWQEASLAQSATLGRPNVGTSGREMSPPYEQENKEEADKGFILQIIQPGLVGLMDGSVSTLAPIFSVAFATHQPFTTFLVGMASALGAGISMAFSEALSDDGDLTGRGNGLLRGGVTGLMTFLSGAGHALPFLLPQLQLALFMSYAVVAIELLGIAAIRHKFFGTSWWLSIVQVVGGGALVFVTALLLGNA
jgi:hypothetical protein